jgi:hypothetical protein
VPGDGATAKGSATSPVHGGSLGPHCHPRDRQALLVPVHQCSETRNLESWFGWKIKTQH